jgi:hypothetical protein
MDTTYGMQVHLICMHAYASAHLLLDATVVGVRLDGQMDLSCPKLDPGPN